MTENMGKWPSGHRKTEKSGYRLAAEKFMFPDGSRECTIFTILEVIWEMSVCYSRLTQSVLACAATHLGRSWDEN